MDSLSVRARGFLEQIPRPDVDYIRGLSPVIAIEQRTGGGSNPRSTVASVSEIADYARLLWMVSGEAFCPECGGKVGRRSLDDCVAHILREAEGNRMMLLAPVLEGHPSMIREELPRLQQRGFQRIRLEGEIVDIDEDMPLPSGEDDVQVDVIVDRIVVREDQRSRIADSL